MWACTGHAEVGNPALAYAWATVWMLRCAELVAVKFEHVVINEKERTVTLKIPCPKWIRRAGVSNAPWVAAEGKPAAGPAPGSCGLKS